MLSTKDREAIVTEAKSWLNTPYRGWSRVKGCGVDCMQFLAGVFVNTGHVSAAELGIPKSYSLQIGQHMETTEYVDGVQRYMREIQEPEVLPGDVVMFKLDKAFAFTHSGIIVSWPDYVIHAIARGGVRGTHGKNDPMLKRADKRFFTLKDKE